MIPYKIWFRCTLTSKISSTNPIWNHNVPYELDYKHLQTTVIFACLNQPKITCTYYTTLHVPNKFSSLKLLQNTKLDCRRFKYQYVRKSEPIPRLCNIYYSSSCFNRYTVILLQLNCRVSLTQSWTNRETHAVVSKRTETTSRPRTSRMVVNPYSALL